MVGRDDRDCAESVALGDGAQSGQDTAGCAPIARLDHEPRSRPLHGERRVEALVRFCDDDRGARCRDGARHAPPGTVEERLTVDDRTELLRSVVA
jgi:hypothetical protein